MTEIRITKPTELLLLERALLEAKLPRLANDGDLAASPIIAGLAERVTTACSELHEQAGVSGKWRALSPGHTYWAIAIYRALADQEYLRKSDPSKREEYARLLLAPFHTDDRTVGAFLAEVDDILQTRRWYHLWIRTKNPFRGGIAFICERSDESFVALSPDGVEIVSSKKLEDIGEALLESGLEPFGYFVEEGTDPADQDF